MPKLRGLLSGGGAVGALLVHGNRLSVGGVEAIGEKLAEPHCSTHTLVLTHADAQFALAAEVSAARARGGSKDGAVRADLGD